jgi:xanthine dehydrogenase accessory factor
VAVATIIRVKGSVPREVGTKMIIHSLGQHYGTVGGGCGEADVIRAGLDVIETGQPRRVEVDLTEDISMQSLGVCGGIMEVYVERWDVRDAKAGIGWAYDGPALDDLLASMEAGRSVALVTVVKATKLCAHSGAKSVSLARSRLVTRPGPGVAGPPDGSRSAPVFG